MIETFIGLHREPTRVMPQAAVLQRICVRPPYYALQNEWYLDGVFSAEAVAELPQGKALGPMRPGDISRHAAIAGSCAAALAQVDDERRFYLATKASYWGFLIEAASGTPVQFEATVKQLDKRRAVSLVRASAHGQPLAELEVTYTVLMAGVFERLHTQRRVTTPRTSAVADLSVYPVRWQGDTGVQVIPRFPIHACGGHFDHYPAAPVAVLMDQLARMAEHAVPRPSYVGWGEITAESLCWAGDNAEFTMTKTSDSVGEARFDGGIRSDGKEVGAMRLHLHY